MVSKTILFILLICLPLVAISCQTQNIPQPPLLTASPTIHASATPAPTTTEPNPPLGAKTDCRSRYAAESQGRVNWPTTDWTISNLEEHCLDPEKVKKAVWYFEENHATSSLLIVRHGELVYEKYFFSIPKPEWPVPIYSITKSILSALIGIAIDQGLLDSLDHKVIEYFPEYFYPQTDPRMEQVTLRDLLTMSAGYNWIEDGEIEARWLESGNLVEAAINLDFVDQPGATFNYSSANTQLLAAILTKIVGEPLRDYAQLNLFSPLGIPPAKWSWAMDDQGYYIGGYGMDFRTRDLARFGYLYLNQGYWDGRQIITTDWIQQSTASQIHTYGGLDYGYLWWVHPWEDQSAFEARGYGGQSIYIVPSLDMVIVVTGIVSPGNSVGAPDPSPLIYEWIVKAVTDK